MITVSVIALVVVASSAAGEVIAHFNIRHIEKGLNK